MKLIFSNAINAHDLNIVTHNAVYVLLFIVSIEALYQSFNPSLLSPEKLEDWQRGELYLSESYPIYDYHIKY